MARSLSDSEIAGCKPAAAAHFPPAFCPIAGLWCGKSGENWARWGRFSLSTLQVRQLPRTKENGRLRGRLLFCVLALDVRPERELPSRFFQALTRGFYCTC